MSQLDSEQDLGLGLKPGSDHYRAYVGPPEDYDLVAAMTFNLMTTLGLRQNHTVFDIGCGSLRNGRLLIPYLNRKQYVGVEPNKWLVKEGIRREVGRSLVRLKKPRFYFSDTLSSVPKELTFDFALAQSIFSHCGLDLFESWLSELAAHIKPSGALVATFLTAKEDARDTGWIYPGCVQFKPETIEALAKNLGFRFRLLSWRHPRQKWALFSAPEFDTEWIEEGPLHWNRSLSLGPWSQRA